VLSAENMAKNGQKTFFLKGQKKATVSPEKAFNLWHDNKV